MGKYPEWLTMFMAILSVKDKRKNYVAMHKMTTEYRDVIAEGMKLKPISERQLKERLKKISHTPRKPAAFIFQFFPGLEPAESRQRSDKMMTRVKGPVWHKKQKEQGISFPKDDRLAVQMHQLKAYRNKKSTRKIKSEVLGHG